MDAKKYKNILLDRDRICEYIELFFEENETLNYKTHSGLKKVSGRLHRVEIECEGGNCILDFHFNNGGKTTIDPARGKKQELSYEIADYILVKTKQPEIKNRSYTSEDIDEAVMDLIYDELSENEFVNRTERNKNEMSLIDKYHNKNNGDSLRVTYYKTKNKIHLQGKPHVIFYQAMGVVTALQPNAQSVIEAQNETYEVSISEEEIDDELKKFVPELRNFLENNHLNIIAGALGLKQINVKLPDYSGFVMPVYKALEGLIKLILRNQLIPSESHGLGHFFYEDDKSVSKLEGDFNQKIHHKEICNSLSVLYTYYNQKRHALIHAKEIDFFEKVIATKSEADTEIVNTLDLMEIEFSKMKNLLN